MLVTERGKVVSRPSLLGALARVGVDQPRLNAEILALGKLFGKEWSSYFEVVGDQGFILHQMARTPRPLFGRPLGEMSRPLFIALLGLILLALAMVLLAMPAKVAPPFAKVQHLTLANGNQVDFRRFGKLTPVVRELKSVLTECRQSRWQTLSVSAPGAGHILHLVVQGGTLEAPKNIKLIADADSVLKPTLAQLQEAGLCD